MNYIWNTHGNSSQKREQSHENRIFHHAGAPFDRNYTECLQEDREAIILADKLGYSEAYVGEHLTDAPSLFDDVFQASLISDTDRSSLAPEQRTYRIHTPVCAAAMMDHLLKGRSFISPGALESDAEALGIRGIDRNEMFAEAIGHILDIWQSEPPYNLEGKHWGISTEKTLMPEIGLGPIAAYQNWPHPPIICTVVAPFSKGVIEMGKKGFLPILANLLDKWVKTHWTNYVRGCEQGRQNQYRGLARGAVDLRS